MLFRSDRKSTRLNSSHTIISYAVFCLKKKNRASTRRAMMLSPRSSQTRSPQRPCHLFLVVLSSVEQVPPPSAASFLSPFFFFLMIRRPPRPPPFPSTPLFR